jgi:hypothetical protein
MLAQKPTEALEGADTSALSKAATFRALQKQIPREYCPLSQRISCVALIRALRTAHPTRHARNLAARLCGETAGFACDQRSRSRHATVARFARGAWRFEQHTGRGIIAGH